MTEADVRRERPVNVGRGGTIAVAARGIGLLASVATGILTARALGPSGKGSLAFLSSASALLIRAGSVGLDGSFTHFHIARRRPLDACIGGVVWITLIVSVALVVVAELALIVFPRLAVTAPLSVAVPFFAATPAYAVLFISTFIFFALERETFFGVFDVGYRAVLLVSLAVALFVANGGLVAAVWVQIGTSVIFAVIAAVAIGRTAGWRLRFDAVLIREMLTHGSRYYTYGLARYLLGYEAVLIGGVLLNDRDTGLLAVGAMLGEVIVLFAGSINLAFYPAVSRIDDPARYTVLMARRVVAMSAAIGVAVALVAQPLIRFLYGARFQPSFIVYLWMLPGFVLFSGEQVASSYFASRGLPWWIVWVLLGGAVMAAIIAAAMTSRFSLNGVAAAIGAVQMIVSIIVLLALVRADRTGT